MPEYSSTSIGDVKRRLINGMMKYMDGDPEFPNDEFDCGYTQKDISKCASIIDAYLNDANASSSDSDILLSVKNVVIQLNELNAKCGHGLIETDQREDLCEIILAFAQKNGLSTNDDVTEEWRQW